MRLLILILAGIFSLSAQPVESIPDSTVNPCDSDLIRQARNEGLTSIPLRKIPQYIRVTRQCRKSGNAGQILTKIRQDQLESDFQSSRQLKGWTSSCAYCVVTGISIYYLRQILK